MSDETIVGESAAADFERTRVSKTIQEASLQREEVVVKRDRYRPATSPASCDVGQHDLGRTQASSGKGRDTTQGS